MLSLDEARARLLATARPLPVETVPLAAAVRRPLARAVYARRTQPPAPLSAMDGYAVRAADAPGPWRVAFDQPAGAPPPPALAPGEAARIFTGALVPAGADAILIQEEAAVSDAGLLTALPGAQLASGQHIRGAGIDFAEGCALLGIGEPLSAAAIGLAAAMGHATLPVRRLPRVALLATGDELAPPGDALPGPGRIVEAVRPMLSALLSGRAEVRDLGIVPDHPGKVAEAIAQGANTDVLVTIGGASVGTHDLVRPALEAAGGAIDTWKVAIRPGKPLIIGRLGEATVLGLPGNPASAYVTALLFLLPLLRTLAGHTRPVPPETPARLAVGLPANGARRDHRRARAEWRGGERWVIPLEPDDSSILSVLAAADALIVRESNAPAVKPGGHVLVLDTESHHF